MTTLAPTVTATTIGPDAHVWVTGHIDLAVHDTLYRVIHQTLEPGVKTVTVDLTSCQMLDSGGIGVLIAARNTAFERRTILTVTGASGIVARVLQNTGVWTILTGLPEPDTTT
ncbi:STAS domain-containing protein [Longispora albida]|uniref:STAS domain-containing protein n=1 Tax=Longispora albida TaxID=203523 RepID=UPI000369C0BB|nr:STAS domain-containing protein [Longispora albida]